MIPARHVAHLAATSGAARPTPATAGSRACPDHRKRHLNRPHRPLHGLLADIRPSVVRRRAAGGAGVGSSIAGRKPSGRFPKGLGHQRSGVAAPLLVPVGRCGASGDEPAVPGQLSMKSRTCPYTVVSVPRALWLRQAVWVFLAPLRATLLSGLMMVSQGDHHVA